MKKIILSFLIIFISSQISFSQKRLNEVEKLATTAKVWGFLKYYHPQVAKGTFDWDKQLIDILPKVASANFNTELSKVYLDWISSLGEVNKCKSCQKKSKRIVFDKNFDLSWIQDSNVFTLELSDKLKYIENNRFQGKNHYVEKAPVGNIKVTNETTYDDFDYPDINYRLLGLFKYWNIIEYFFPYKYLTDKKWDDVLIEMIPKFLESSDKVQYHLVIRELVAKLDDSHAWVSMKSTKYKYLPVEVRYINKKPVVSKIFSDSLASMNDLKLGDIILTINNVKISDLLQEYFKYKSGSNLSIKKFHSLINIIGGIEDTVLLSIKRNGVIFNKTMKRYDYKQFKIPKTDKWKSLGNSIGYVNMDDINRKDVSIIMDEFKDFKGLILDLRCYPNFHFVFSFYINSKRREFAKIIKPSIDYPGKFVFIKTKSSGKKNSKAFKGKVVLLVNENTMSRSEYICMSLQNADDVITIGSQTAGADGDVVRFEYLGGFKTAMSGNGIFYPDGTESQRKGVKIDIEVKPTIKGLGEGRDEVLEKAIEVINNSKIKNH